MKTYDEADVTLVSEWVNKYFEANALINKIFTVENLEHPPTMPSIGDEIEYQRLRFWFRKKHDQFVPIWANFCASKGYSIEFTSNSDEMEYMKNPFLYFYDPGDLLELAYTMGATDTPDNWNPNRQAVELVLNINNRFCCTVIHLLHWIGEFAETNVKFP